MGPACRASSVPGHCPPIVPALSRPLAVRHLRRVSRGGVQRVLDTVTGDGLDVGGRPACPMQTVSLVGALTGVSAAV